MNWDHPVPCSPFPQIVIETEGGLNRHGHFKVPLPFKEISLASVENRILKSLHGCKMKCAIWRFIFTPWFYLGSLNMFTHSFSYLFSAVSSAFGGASDQSWLAYAGDLVTEQELFLFGLQQWRYVLTLRATSLDISKLPPEITLIRKHLTDANLAANLTVARWQWDTPPKVPVTREAESSTAKDAGTVALQQL